MAKGQRQVREAAAGSLDWPRLLHAGRRRPSQPRTEETRTEFERDYDRILFSTPVRRLKDKTQVFPLESHDSVRTRLTHSHEVSNLCRAMGLELAFRHGLAADVPGAQRDVPVLLATIGLAHDLGNPPFGHPGEQAIQDWFQRQEARVFPPDCDVSRALRQDFLRFEGNAHTLRLVTRLQRMNDDYGLNLCYGTLAALMKYPVPSYALDAKRAALRKPGFFASEQTLVEEVWQATGLQPGVRHPLTYLLEAADDIAYSVLDVEDAAKKGLISFADVLAWLEHEVGDDPFTEALVKAARRRHREFRGQELSPRELDDLSLQAFRVEAMGRLIPAATRAYRLNETRLMAAECPGELLGGAETGAFVTALKAFNLRHVYRHASVLKLEVRGFQVLHALMELLWQGIVDRADPNDPGSRRRTPFTQYVWQRISENYRRVLLTSTRLPLRYREAQLLCDMVAGMTDSYALSLLDELTALRQSGGAP